MFHRIVTLSCVALSLSILAAAMPSAATGPTTVTIASAPKSTPASECSTGAMQCCQKVQKSSDPEAASLLGLLGIVLQGVDLDVGLTCTPITVIGVDTGNSCKAQVVCCQDNSKGGLISLGCIPVTL